MFKVIHSITAVFVFSTMLAGFAHAGDVLASGEFVGASDHITTGKVTIVKDSDGAAKVILADDFSLDGAPDPRVGLGKNGTFDEGTDLGVLENLTGGQTYKVPEGIDTSGYNEVYIWCRKYSVPLGVAKIE